MSRSTGDSEPGEFPQVSGIQYLFDAESPAGSRIVEVKVNGVPLDDAKKYTLATTTFTGLDGGDGYAMFKGAKIIIPPDQAPTDADAVEKSNRHEADRAEG